MTKNKSKENAERGFKMRKERGKKLFICVFGITLLFLMILSVCFFQYAKKSVEVPENLQLAMVIVAFLLSIMLFIPAFIEPVEEALKRKKKVDSYFDTVFSKIDIFKESKNASDCMVYRLINSIYLTGGPVDAINIEQRIERLLKRKAYLKNVYTSREMLKTCIISLVISICCMWFPDFLANYLGVKDIFRCMFIAIIIGIFILIFCMYRYETKDVLVEYEIERINQKIISAGENYIEIENNDELLKKQIVLNAFYSYMDTFLKKRTKRELERAVLQLESMEDVDADVVMEKMSLLKKKQKEKLLHDLKEFGYDLQAEEASQEK